MLSFQNYNHFTEFHPIRDIYQKRLSQEISRSDSVDVVVSMSLEYFKDFIINGRAFPLTMDIQKNSIFLSLYKIWVFLVSSFMITEEERPFVIKLLDYSKDGEIPTQRKVHLQMSNQSFRTISSSVINVKATDIDMSCKKKYADHNLRTPSTNFN